MVPLSELLAAQSEAKMNKEETQTKVKDLTWLQGQLSKAQEQINDARLEAAKLRADMSCMVQRSDLEDAKAQVKALDEAQRKESQQHRAAVSELQERITALEHEKRETLSSVQVRASCSALPCEAEI
jgi:chromosome segregation ATPase